MLFWPPYSQSGRLARLLDCSRLADWSRLRPIGRLDWPSWPVQSGHSGMTSNLPNLARCPIWPIAESRLGRRDGFVSGCKLGVAPDPFPSFPPDCGPGHDWLDWLCPIGSLAAALDWHVFWRSTRLPDWCCSIAARLL